MDDVKVIAMLVILLYIVAFSCCAYYLSDKDCNPTCDKCKNRCKKCNLFGGKKEEEPLIFYDEINL